MRVFIGMACLLVGVAGAEGTAAPAPPARTPARPPAAAAPVPPPARPTAPLRVDAGIAAARRTLLALMDAASVPGAAVAVSYDGKMLWSEGFGMANLELEVSATPQSRFRIASISKNLTGTAVAKLVEEGRLDLDAPIGRYVPNLPAVWDSVTARQLASHTSGIAHYSSESDALETRHFDTTAQALTKIAALPMVNAPGAKEVYSSYAYTVLAAALEGASGKDFLTLMREEIFEPLGMLDTVPDQVAQIIPQRTGFYAYGADGKVQNAPFLDLSDRWAGSGFLSTAEDLARFGAAHCGPGFLEQRTLELIVTRTPLPDSTLTREGLGWGPRQDWEGRPELWGNGITPGATCGLLVFPQARLSIALLTNIRRAPIDRPELQVLALRFLDAIEGRATLSVDPLLSDDWTLACRQADKPFEGTMHLSVAAGACGGTITLPDGNVFSIVDGMQRGTEQWLIALHPSAGLLPVRLHAEGDEWAGEILRVGISLRATRREVPPDTAPLDVAPPDSTGH